MKEFLLANWISIVVIVALAGNVLYLVINKKWDILRAEAYKAMLLAETAIIGTQQGQNKFNSVFVQLYSMLPAWLRFFIPANTLKVKLQEWYEQIKDFLDNGKVDNSVSQTITSNSDGATVITAK